MSTTFLKFVKKKDEIFLPAEMNRLSWPGRQIIIMKKETSLHKRIKYHLNLWK